MQAAFYLGVIYIFQEILQVHAKDKPMGDDVDLHRVAQTTAGFTGGKGTSFCG